MCDGRNGDGYGRHRADILPTAWKACDALRAMGACEDLQGTHLMMTV